MHFVNRSTNIIKSKYFKIKFITSILIGVGFATILGLYPGYVEIIKRDDKSNTFLNLPNTTTLTPTPTLIPKFNIHLDLNQIFIDNYSQNRSQIDILPQNQVIRIMLGGDVMLGRAVGFNITRLKKFEYPFLKIADKLKQSDLSIINLENPIVDDCPITTEGMVFCSTPGTLSGLKTSGIDVVNVANNHILNYGQSGLSNTLMALDNIGINHIGSSYQPAYYQVRDKKIGILGYSYFGGQPYLDSIEIDKIIKSVTALKSQSDLVIVSMHWGKEYEPHPQNWQRLVAYQVVDAGADVVFGHHPHWVQGMELYNNKPIFYSLGNLVFDQDWSKETREGLVVETVWWNGGWVGVYFHPIFMENLGQPSWQPVGYGNLTVAKVENLSQSLQQTQSQILQLLNK